MKRYDSSAHLWDVENSTKALAAACPTSSFLRAVGAVCSLTARSLAGEWTRRRVACRAVPRNRWLRDNSFRYQPKQHIWVKQYRISSTRIVTNIYNTIITNWHTITARNAANPRVLSFLTNTTRLIPVTTGFTKCTHWWRVRILLKISNTVR